MSSLRPRKSRGVLGEGRGLGGTGITTYGDASA